MLEPFSERGPYPFFNYEGVLRVLQRALLSSVSSPSMSISTSVKAVHGLLGFLFCATLNGLMVGMVLSTVIGITYPQLDFLCTINSQAKEP